jgi:hypothetical protein
MVEAKRKHEIEVRDALFVGEKENLIVEKVPSCAQFFFV